MDVCEMIEVHRQWGSAPEALGYTKALVEQAPSAAHQMECRDARRRTVQGSEAFVRTMALAGLLEPPSASDASAADLHRAVPSASGTTNHRPSSLAS